MNPNAAVLGGMRTIWNVVTKTQDSPVTTSMHACCGLLSVLQVKANVQASDCICQPFPSTNVIQFLISYGSASLWFWVYPSWIERHHRWLWTHQNRVNSFAASSSSLAQSWKGMQPPEQKEKDPGPTLHASPKAEQGDRWLEARTPYSALSPAFLPIHPEDPRGMCGQRSVGRGDRRLGSHPCSASCS